MESMVPPLYFYNQKSRSLELFKSIKPNQVGLYLCGPTVYAPPHIGHLRSALFGDLLHRVLRAYSYQVTYVRNITDVGHLLETETGEQDKISRVARKESVNPMAVAEKYTLRYQEALTQLGCLPPTISPRATGHITEQIELIQRILEAGYAYLVSGSVYFDLNAYLKKKDQLYGTLSGRTYATQRGQTRRLKGGDEKKHPLDFALWKKAAPNHLMQWPSPWGKGFPGWHIECSAMSQKYLGLPFDIHAGGIDLQFPHHECELIQNHAAYETDTARVWLHHNLVTLQGQKMSKSQKHVVSWQDLFSKRYAEELGLPIQPMAVRFYLLSTHYRSVLDFSPAGLIRATKGYHKILSSIRQTADVAKKAKPGTVDNTLKQRIHAIYAACWQAVSKDLNTPLLIAQLFELSRLVNKVAISSVPVTVGAEDWAQVEQIWALFFFGILGLEADLPVDSTLLLERVAAIYQKAKQGKAYGLVDFIRAQLAPLHIRFQDRADTTSWEITT